MASAYLSIVIPTYNEESRLPDTLTRVDAYMSEQSWTAELIVVDDGSVDRTRALVRSFAVDHPHVVLVENDHRGKGYAVRTGMLAAQGRYVLFSDADLATPITEAGCLLGYLEQGYDIAIGSREGLGSRRHNEPWLRHVMGRVFNRLVRMVAVSGFRDTQCGFKAFRREVAHDLFGRLRIHGSGAGRVSGASVTAFDVEVLYLAVRTGYNIREVPVEWHYGAQSKVNPLVDSARMVRDVLRVRWNAHRGVYARAQDLT
jgi:glycosyltransferase involved in cell wall biosynthesis